MNVLQKNKISATCIAEKKTHSVFLYTGFSIKRFTRSFTFLWVARRVRLKLLLHEDSQGQELPQIPIPPFVVELLLFKVNPAEILLKSYSQFSY